MTRKNLSHSKYRQYWVRYLTLNIKIFRKMFSSVLTLCCAVGLNFRSRFATILLRKSKRKLVASVLGFISIVHVLGYISNVFVLGFLMFVLLCECLCYVFFHMCSFLVFILNVLGLGFTSNIVFWFPLV